MSMAKLVRWEQAHSVLVAVEVTTMQPSSLHCSPVPSLIREEEINSLL